MSAVSVVCAPKIATVMDSRPHKKQKNGRYLHLNDIPASILGLIFSFLDVRSLNFAAKVSKRGREAFLQCLCIFLTTYRLRNTKSLYALPKYGLDSSHILFLVRYGRVRQRRGMSASTGVGHTLCTKHDSVYAFGDGGYGVLGLGVIDKALKPMKLALDKYLQDPTETIVQVTCGSFNTGLLSDKGRVYTFGCEENMKLGYRATSPQLVPKVIPFKRVVEQISFGSNHSLMRVEGGRVYSFGSSPNALGHGDKITETRPRRIKGLSKEKAIYVSAGMQHSLVLTERGQVFSFGFGRSGELGLGGFQHSSVPQLITSFVALGTCIIRVSAGASFSLAIDDKGVLYSFGRGFGGRLGHGKTDNRFINEPLPRPLKYFVEKHIKVVDCKAAHTHSIVLTAFGNVYTFGMNDYGKLGIGHENPEFIPQRVSVKRSDGTEVKFIAVNGGEWHTLLISRENDLYTCGGGWFGRLGHGNQKNLYTPHKVESLE